MSTETQALEFLEAYDVTHVVVFTSLGTDGTSHELYDAGYGDEGKWRWMARIGGLDDKLYGNYSLGQDWIDTNEDGQVRTDELIANELGVSTVLYKLMKYASETIAFGSSGIQLEHFEREYFSQDTAQWFQDVNGYAAAPVLVYKVVYD
jgi:hypothetical protein